ncbi:MAG TPA: transglutaminase family protein [Acidimicrobiia bacterium]|nr:transglutaminase family protein [Acidimicrobiia bacterium]
MSWRLRIRHETTYHYADIVHASYNEARISPLDTAHQFTLEHRVVVDPAANLYRYRDYWGSRVHAFDLHGAHTKLTVVGTSLVETAARTPEMDATVAWEDLDSRGLQDRLYEYLQQTPTTVADDAIRAVAAELRTAATPAAALELLGTWLRGHVEYQLGWTNVTTTAVEVLKAGRGVCQDYVHLGLAILRAAGIPARYASGYLHPHADAAIGEPHVGEGHAWLEAWVGDWHPVDPTSGSAVAERHVLVARGRDYTDVTPLKGVYHGGPSRGLEVKVELTRVA